ncbi:hypothetical protein [Blautia massiliensis (ex Durand et al. 2017)]
MLASAYQPYLYLPRPVSRRHPMDVGRRAKQFAPFAALRGLDETIRQQEIIYEPKRDLSEEKKNELDMKLRILTYGMKIQATYFQKFWKDPSVGQYHTLSGTIEFFDPSVHLRIDDTEIQIQDICDLTGDVFETIEISC